MSNVAPVYGNFKVAVNKLVLPRFTFANVFSFQYQKYVLNGTFELRFQERYERKKESAKSGSGKRKRTVYNYTRNRSFLRPHTRLKNTLDNFTKVNSAMVRIKTFIKYSNHCL